MNLEYFLKAYLKERPLFLSLIRAKEAWLYQKFLPLKRPVLDLGCGDGFFAKIAFSDRGFTRIESRLTRIMDKRAKKTPRGWPNGLPRGGGSSIDVGLDLEDSRVEEARRLGVYKKIVIYDGKKIPFQDNYFSTVVSNCVLEHVEDLSYLLREFFRVIKPGGVFLTTVMAKPWEENLFGAKLLGNWYKDWMRRKQVHRNLLTKKILDQTFQEAGFKIKESVGYLSPSACRLIDVCHYLSIPSLISYKLWGKWVLWPGITKFVYPIDYLSNLIYANTTTEQSGALFYVLKKNESKK